MLIDQVLTDSVLDRKQGQQLFTKTDPASLANMDKQIYRLIGKAISLAAYVLVKFLLYLPFTGSPFRFFFFL